jgi:hypothetical protein
MMHGCCAPRAGWWHTWRRIESVKEHGMGIKIFSGILAVLLLGAYVTPYAIKMKSIALVIVILIGFTMMAIDLWQSLRSKED